MIGAIVGDVVGSKYEWAYFKSKDFELFDPDKCTFTDDSVMTVAVAAALADWKKKGGDVSTLAIAKMKEFGKRFPYAGYGGRFDEWLNSEDPQPYNSWGNGSGMRVSPVGLYAKTLDEALALAALTASVSHNHAECCHFAR